MSAHATRDDMDAVAAALRDLIAAVTHATDAQAQLLANVTRPDQLARANTATASINNGGAGLWAAVTACIVAITLCLTTALRVSDLRDDMHAARARADAHEDWARVEAQIVRSYIWQGKVPRANPYPKTDPKK